MSSQALEVLSALAELPVYLKRFIDTIYALAGKIFHKLDKPDHIPEISFSPPPPPTSFNQIYKLISLFFLSRSCVCQIFQHLRRLRS